MNHRAEIRWPAREGAHIVVGHHRVDEVELNVDLLSGGHLFNLSLAGCVFNNVCRLAEERGVSLEDVSVVANGEFDDDGSKGVDYSIELRGRASEEELRALAQDAQAESTIVLAVRKGAPATLKEIRAHSATA